MTQMTEIPDIGTMWVHAQSQRLYRVLHVDPQRVLLQGDVQTMKIPLYDWPGQLEPFIEAGHEEEAPVITALLVGGSEGHHFDRIWDQAADLGVDIDYHWAGDLKRLPSKLPSDIQLVIVLVSHLSHSMYDATKLMAKSHATPLARVPSSGFKPSLQLELSKLGFEGYGATYRKRPTRDGHYSWTGSTYEWREPAVELPPPPSGPVASGSSPESEPMLGVMAMALLGLAAYR